MLLGSEYFESYHYHTCIVLPEKDVLETDIFGTGTITRLRRWWYDLFLLSYDCDRSRGFYRSSHSLRVDRVTHYRKYHNRIHPLSKFRNFWDFLILHVFIANKLIFRFTSTFLYNKLPIHLYYFAAFLELLIIADLYINLKSGYINIETKRVILDTKQSLLNFCSKKLFLHFAAAVPLHWLMFLKYRLNVTCGMCKSNRFMCCVKVISIFGLFRIYETSAYWSRSRHSITKTGCCKLLRIGIVALMTMIQLFDLSDVVSLFIIIKNGYVEKHSIMAYASAAKYGLLKDAEIPNFVFICLDFARMIQSMQLFSYYAITKAYYVDIVTTVVAFLLACTVCGWCLMVFLELINSILYSSEKRIKSAKNYLHMKNLPKRLKLRVVEYFKTQSSKITLTETRNSLYRSLPQKLKNDIKVACYMKIVMRIPLFRHWPLTLIEELVILLKRKVYLQNDVVALPMVPGKGLMIIDKGILAVYTQYHKEIGHLIDGDYFGEMSLVTNKEVCTSHVVAVTECRILVLEKIPFRVFMKQHPQMFYTFKLELRQRNKKQQHLDEEGSISDDEDSSH